MVMRNLKSIILITVDCLRADHIGFMGYGRPTTPFLDSLAAESFVFPTAIVAGAPTYYSFPSILASRYPLALGRDVLGLAPDEPNLASALKGQGYATAAFSAANPYISPRFGYQQGFDTFQDFLHLDTAGSLDSAHIEAESRRAPTVGWTTRLNRKLQAAAIKKGVLGTLYDELYFQYCQRWATPRATSLNALRRFPTADVIVDHACEWLTSVEDTPFFLWLHLMDPHAPYYPTDEALALMQYRTTPFRARYLNSYWNRGDAGGARLTRHRDEIVALYDSGIRWVDVQMERLIATLRESKKWDDCIFALTADHGEEFLDHGGRFHPPSRLMEELIHVPLLMRVPGARKRKVSESPFSLLHLAPTLLEAAHAPIPSAFQGCSHWEQVSRGAADDSVATSECVAGCTNPFLRENRLGPRVMSVRESRYKLILHFDPPGEALYDLEADSGEHAPLPIGSQKPVRRRLLEVARQHLRQSVSHRDPAARVRARLRELQLEWKKPADTITPASLAQQ
jgi:arylsulfatase A-like enzyme